MTTFKRLLVILFGYLGACLVAGFFLTYGMLAFGMKGPGRSVELSTLLFVTPFSAILAFYFSVLPSVILIFLWEAFGRRDWFSYALGGGVSGFLIAAFVQFPMEPDAVYNGLGGPAVVAAGIVAGTAYWLFAGRGAGMWVAPAEPPAAPTSPEP